MDNPSKKELCIKSREERGDWDVNKNSTQSLIITFSYSLLNNLGDIYLILIAWFIKLSIQTFQPHIVIYRFVYYLCWCTSIYRPLSYSFRSLIKSHNHYFNTLRFHELSIKQTFSRWGYSNLSKNIYLLIHILLIFHLVICI